MADSGLTRRQLLAWSGAVGATHLGLHPARARAEAEPRRGGTLTIRAWEPPNFDVQQLDSFKTQVIYSFTHSRLLKHRAGPGVTPGTFPLEGDLAESWWQPSDLTYLFRLRRGVRWHGKPPVNGRELTAEDVAYSVQRGLGEPGRTSRPLFARLDRVEAVDRYTVKFVLNRPFAWLLDVVATPMTLPIIPRECVETFGDLKKPESLIGSGPWQLESYRRNVAITFVRHADYFLPGLPHIDRVVLVLEQDNAAAAAAFLSGRYDLGWDLPGVIARSDWVQLAERLPARRPGLRTAEIHDSSAFVVYMRTDKSPFNDAKVRRAMSMAINRQEIVDSVLEGAGVINPPIPAALKEWSLPVDQLEAGAAAYHYDPAEARRLLAEVGYGTGFQITMYFTSYGRTYQDMLQLVVHHLRAVGIDANLSFKEYGAFVSTVPFGRFEGMALGAFPPAIQPYTPLFSRYYPGQAPNAAHVDDPTLTGLLDEIAGARDPAKRRELVYAFQRRAALQQYYIHLPSGIHTAAWDRTLRNYAPNMSYDYGGRLVAAWLTR